MASTKEVWGHTNIQSIASCLWPRKVYFLTYKMHLFHPNSLKSQLVPASTLISKVQSLNKISKLDMGESEGMIDTEAKFFSSYEPVTGKG